MLTIQDKVQMSTRFLRRKLFDSNLRIQGMEVKAILCSVEKDNYENTSITINGYKDTVARLIFPNDEIMLGKSGNDTTVHLYDLLPIQGYLPFQEDVKEDDIIVFLYLDEYDNPVPVILVVTRLVAKFNRSITWKKYMFGLYHAEPFDDLKNIINEYLEIWRRDQMNNNNPVYVSTRDLQHQVNFDDNTVKIINVGDATINRALIVKYTVETGQNYEFGKITLLHDNDMVNIDSERYGLINAESDIIQGLEYSADLNNHNMRLILTATDVGSTPIKFRYTIEPIGLAQ